MIEKKFSVIIPARNEEAMIAQAIESLLRAAAQYSRHDSATPHLAQTPIELIVCDNVSTDRTALVVAPFVENYGVRYEVCPRLRAPCARNYGASVSSGRILIFMDADTRAPLDAFSRIDHLCNDRGIGAGITRLASLEGGWRALAWWSFWNQVRRLPLARAKAMPAFMFCTRDAFDRFGPFDETVEIGEEWPILAGLYRLDSKRVAYDQTLTALSSNRRMELQRFGYLRVLCKYLWAIAHPSGRVNYGDHFRHKLAE
ncbi:MAG: glycosyltransferase [Candidatus Sumerlaeota bacterium]|nr:glycosyltransferase [Candidatus Sumerlaeota bacterium]